MGVVDFFRRVLGGGEQTQDQAASPAAMPPAPAPSSATATSPGPSSATPGSGGAREGGASGSGMSEDELARIQGAYTSGHTGDRERADPRTLELLDDRRRAQEELRDRFQIMTPAQLEALGGEALPNQISQAELERLAVTFSNIRMGESQIQLDTAGMADEDAATFRQGTMNDIGSLLQTQAGRDLVSQLDAGVGRDGERHTTTIGQTFPGGAYAGASDAANEGLRQTTGTDMTARYAPGQDSTVGNPDREPWWPQRSDVTLFHELTHALHGVTGTTEQFTTPPFQEVMAHGINDMPTPTIMEEWRTVGLGPFAGEQISENSYRAERRRLAGQPGARAGDEGPHMVRRDQYASWS